MKSKFAEMLADVVTRRRGCSATLVSQGPQHELKYRILTRIRHQHNQPSALVTAMRPARRLPEHHEVQQRAWEVWEQIALCLEDMSSIILRCHTFCASGSETGRRIPSRGSSFVYSSPGEEVPALYRGECPAAQLSGGRPADHERPGDGWRAPRLVASVASPECSQ